MASKKLLTDKDIVISAASVAAELHTSPEKVSRMIEVGEMPIGYVDTSGKRRRTIILRGRWEAWINGADLMSAGKGKSINGQAL